MDRLLPIIIIAFFFMDCGTKVKVQSPIVFEKEMPAQENAITGSTKETFKSTPVDLGSLPPAKTSKPDSIALSLSRNINRDYRILGNVVVEDLSTWGFTRDLANQGLKAKAYEVYGNKVDAIIGVKYEKRVGLLYSDNNLCRALGTAIQFEEQTPSLESVEKSTPLIQGVEKRTSLIPEKKQRAPSRSVEVITSSLSIDKKYEVLGIVEVRNDDSTWGFSHQSADNALRERAREIYGDQVNAIINVTYDKMTGLFYGENNLYRAAGTAIKFKVFRCPYCDNEINEGSRYCSYCGKRIQ